MHLSAEKAEKLSNKASEFNAEKTTAQCTLSQTIEYYLGLKS